MAFGIDEEGVVPVAAATGAFLDMGEVDGFVLEGLENVDEGARFIGGGEHDGGFVVAGAAGFLARDDDKACDVVGVVFDAWHDGVKAIELASHGGTDGGGFGHATFGEDGARFVGDGLNGVAGAWRRDEFGARILRGDPVLALLEDFGLGVDFFHALGRGEGEEGVMYGELNFGANGDGWALAAAVADGSVAERVEGFDDAATGGIFDGSEAALDVAALNFGEDALDGAKIDEIGGGTEVFAGGLVGVGALGA